MVKASLIIRALSDLPLKEDINETQPDQDLEAHTSFRSPVTWDQTCEV